MTETTRHASPLPQTTPREQRLAFATVDAAPRTRDRPRFPGWRWVAVATGFPMRA
jgi:hypothetical protein